MPVDPKAFKVWSALPSTKRDLLFGLAVSEMADLIHDRKSRQAMKTVGGQTHEGSGEPDAGSHRGLVDADFNPRPGSSLTNIRRLREHYLQRMRGFS